MIRTIQDLRHFADEVARQSPVLKLPRDEALMHSFRLAQALQTINEVGAEYRGKLLPGYESMRGTQDLLRWLTFKIFRLCPQGGDFRALTEIEDMKSTLASLGDFILFSKIQDAIVSVEAGFFSLAVEDAGKKVCFRSNPETNEDLVKRIVSDQERRIIEMSEFRDKAFEVDVDLSSLNARIDPETFTMEYRFIWKVAMPLGKHLSFPELLPDTASSGAYSMGDFRKFWHYLAIRMAVHLGLLVGAVREMKFQWTAHNSATVIFEIERLVRNVRHFTSLRGDVISEILRDLTYDPDSTPDVIYQPLVPVGHGHLMTIPLLILGSNPERNLLAVIDRLPWRVDGALALKDVRESIMLKKIEEVAGPLGISARSRVGLGTSGSALEGEIDIVLWREADYCLAVSLKWFYGPDSMHEVRLHDERFQQGLKKHEICLEYLRRHAPDVSERYSFDPPLAANAEIKGILVSMVGTASELVRHDEIPIVTLERFLQGLAEANGDLRAFFEQMFEVSRGSELPEISIKTEEMIFEHSGIKFSFPGASVV